MITTVEQICMHAFVAFSYKEGKSSPDEILTPTVLITISMLDQEFFLPEDVHRQVKNDFSKDFPFILIQRELSKLVSKEIIERDFTEKTKLVYKLKKDLTDVKDNYRKSQEETNYFLKKLQEYITDKKTQYGTLSISQLMKRIEEFCSENLTSLIICFGQNSHIIKKTSSKLIDTLICDFFENRIKNDDRLLSAFENIFNGILLAKISETCAENLNNTNYTMNSKTVFLDTNVLLRILNLQSEYLNILGHELYNLLIENDFELRVFNDTIKELNYLLRGYKKAEPYFIKGKEISHVYQVLKNNDIDVYDIDDFIQDIPKKLQELGITIDEETEYPPEDYKIYEDRTNELAKIKYEKKNEDSIEFDIGNDSNQKYINQAQHDLYCINQIHGLRGKGIVNRFEDAKYYFITADSVLLKFNKSNYNFSNISETIGDYTISFLLYFYKPNNMKGISLRSFIAANYANADLSISNWMNYFTAVNKKYQEGKLSKSQFGYLLTKTILNNEKFVEEDLDSLVNEGIEEYNKMIQETDKLRDSKEYFEMQLSKSLQDNANSKARIKKLESINTTIQNDSHIKDIELRKKQSNIDTLEEDKRTLKDDKQSLANEVSELKKSLKIIRYVLFGLFAFIFIFGICIFPMNKIFGGIMTFLGFILNIANVIDLLKKWIIKD